MKLVEDGDVDAIMNLSYTKERSEFMYFIGPIRDETVALIVPEGSNYSINSLDDLKKLPGTVGKVNGAYYGAELSNKIAEDKSFSESIHLVTNSAQLAPMLRKSRIAAFMINSDDFYYKLRTDASFKGLKAHAFPISQSHLFFGFSKASVSEQLNTKLKQAYERAKSKGKFDGVIESYKK